MLPTVDYSEQIAQAKQERAQAGTIARWRNQWKTFEPTYLRALQESRNALATLHNDCVEQGVDPKNEVLVEIKETYNSPYPYNSQGYSHDNENIQALFAKFYLASLKFRLDLSIGRAAIPYFPQRELAR